MTDFDDKKTPEEIAREAGADPPAQSSGADLESALASTKALLSDADLPDKESYVVFDQYGSYHGRVTCYDEGEAIGTVETHGEGDQRGLEFHAIKLPFTIEERPAKAMSFTDEDMIRFAHHVSHKGAGVDRGFSDDQINNMLAVWSKSS